MSRKQLTENLINNQYATNASKREEKIDNLKEGEKLDPLKFKKITLGEDYYSLTWACLKTNLFSKKEYLKGKIFLLPSDYFSLYFDFIIFMLMLSLTIILVVRNVVIDDVYVEGTVAIIVCRIILMVFAMKKLTPEFRTGYAKYIYSFIKRKEFTYPGFAQFVGICQVVCAGIALIGVLFFVCTADQFGELLTNFSGLCILSELDDWLGSCIVLNKIDFEKQDLSEIELEDVNDRLSVIQKMALIDDEDLEILIDDDVTENCHWIILYFDKINKIIPWDYIIPLFAVFMSVLMPYIKQSFIFKAIEK